MGKKTASKDKTAGRKHVKTALNESEEKYRLIFENAPSGIFHFDQHGVITSCNDNFVDIIGSSYKALIGLNTLKLSNKIIVAEIKKTLKGKPGYYEGIYQSDTGHKTTQIRAQFSPIKPNGKTVSGGIGIVEDVTGRKIVEERINQIVNEQKAILDTVSIGISHVIDRKIIWANAAHDKIFGYKTGETKGIETAALYHNKAAYEKLGRESYPLLKGGKKFTTEMQMLKKDGTEFWCSLTGHIINTKSPEDGYIWIVQDITERKETEKVLQENEERYRLVMENSLDAIILAVSHGPLYSANKAARKMLQRTEKEICSSKREELIDFNDPTFKTFVEERRRTGKAKGELFMFKKDGTRFPVELSSTAFKDSQGQVKTGWIIRDITDRKKADELIKESESRLKAVLNNSRDAIGVHINGLWEMCNPAGLKLFGFTSEQEVIGTSLLNVIAKSERARIKDFVKHREKGSGAPQEYVTRGLRKDGTEFDMDVKLSTYSINNKTYVVVTLRDITERKQAEEKLHEQIKNFRLLFENSPIGILSATPDGTIIDSNNSLLNILGSPSLEATKQINIVRFPPLIKSGYADNFKKCIQENTIVFFEFDYTSIWGKELFFASYLVPLTNDEGVVEKVYNFMVDITERKRNEEEIIRHEKNFRLLFESSPLGIYIAAPDGTIIDGNSALLKILGSPSIEATKQINVLTFPPLVQNGYAANFKKCINENTVIFVELFYKTKWDKELFLSSYLVPLANDKGEVEKVYTLMSDITKRKKAELAQRDSEEKLRAIINTSPDAVGLFDANANVLMMNPAAAKIFGYNSPEEMIGKNATEFFMPEDKSGALELIGQILKTGLVKNSEFKLLRKNGTWFYSEFNTSALYDIEGKPAGIVAITRDITERKLAEEELVRHSKEINSLYESSIDLAVLPENLDNLLNSIINKAILLLNRKDGGLYLFDKERGDLYVAAATNTLKPIGTRVKIGEGMAGRVAETRKPLIVDDYSKWQYRLPIYNGSSLASVIEVPIIYRNEFLGVLVVEEYGIAAQKFSEDDLRLLTIYAIQVAGAIYSAQEYYHVRKIMEELDNYFTNALDLFCIASIDGKFIKLNREWENILGYNIPDLIGKNIIDYIHSDDKQITLQVISDLAQGKSIYNFINRYVTKAQSIRIIEWRAKATGNLIYAAARDITERTQAEEALRQSEEKFYKAFNNSPLTLSLTDIETGMIIEVNEKACNLSGFSREELIGNTVTEIGWIKIEDRKKVQAILQKEGAVKDIELNLCAKNGNEVTVSYSCTIIEIDGKKVLLSISEDLTERKKAQTELKESEERLRTLINSTPDIICFKDKYGRWLITNESYLELFNLKDISYYGKTDAELAELTAPVFKKAFIASVENDISTWNSKSITKSEMYISGLNDEIKIYDVIKVPIFEPNGDRKGLVVLGRDITIQKKNEDQLKKLNEELQISRSIVEENLYQKNLLVEDLTEVKEKLEKLNSEKDKFFSIIAHDMKSPFQGFIGLTELISNDINNFNMTELSELNKDMHDNAKNLYKLLENLLLWARTQQGVVSFNPKKINLFEIISQNISLIVKRGEQKNINIISEVAADQMVSADEEMLNIILRNLLSNALKFTKKGGRVIVSSKEIENHMVEISVADTGIGMNENLSRNAFNINEKVGREGTEGEKSTGLGLLLCKEFVEKHGGKIWVESEENIGSKFYFTMPGNEVIY